MSASSSTNAWAVGNYCTTTACTTLILHWNGRAWSKVASPNPGRGSRTLDGVSAVSATSAWAVGDYCTTTACRVDATLILHWNGKAWSQVKSRNPSPTINQLDGVSATSATNAWAVGQYFRGTAGPYETLILHWNGRAWSKVTSPNPSLAGGNFLYGGVSATSAANAWAVGSYYSSGNALRTMTLHWNGKAWSTVKSPNPSSTANQLDGVSATSARNSVAVGYAQTPRTGTLTLRWNGTGWSKVASPSPAGAGLASVSATSGRNAWAVGQYCASGCSGPGAVIDTLTVHWNGTSWSKVKSPSPSSTGRNLLFSVSATSATNAWAVGVYPNKLHAQTALILHWNGRAWSKA